MSYSSTTSYRHQRYFCTNSLKRTSVWHGERKCLFPLRIYTALKQLFSCSAGRGCLFSLRIYTALKPDSLIFTLSCSLFSLRIYTALKLPRWLTDYVFVCFPYEFTLLSNLSVRNASAFLFVFPTNLHCSQTGSTLLLPSSMFVFPTNLHCSQTSNRPRIIFCKIPVFLHRSHHSPLY